jgi:competence protein ComEA
MFRRIVGIACVAAALAGAQAAAAPSAGTKEAGKAVPDGQGIGLEGVVNVNTATPEELELLPGIGPSKAKAIVEYRAKKPFKDPRHLIRVKGIGRKILQRILPFLVVKGATTLKKT